MRGPIGVDSEPDRGWRFWFEIDFEVVALPASPDACPTAPSGHASTHANRAASHVLVAEDDAVNQKVLGALLQGIGVGFVMVGDGAKALEAWRIGESALVLMDRQMPVLDGYEATRAIRQEENERGLARTPQERLFGPLHDESPPARGPSQLGA